MKMKGGAASAAVFVVLAAGAWGVLAPAAANAAIEPAVLEAVESSEVLEVATGVASLLESFPADSEEQVFAAAVHRYLADSVYENEILQDALEVVLTGAWSDSQAAAIRSIYAVYAIGDVEAPGGGAGAPGRASVAQRGVAALEAPGGGGSLSTQSLPPSVDEEGGEGEEGGVGFTEPPPPPSGSGGTSDYRP